MIKVRMTTSPIVAHVRYSRLTFVEWLWLQLAAAFLGIANTFNRAAMYSFERCGTEKGTPDEHGESSGTPASPATDQKRTIGGR